MWVYDEYFGRLVNEVDKKDAISLVKSDSEFQSFCGREKKRIPNRISWREIPWMETETRMKSRIDNSGTPIIYIRNSPVPIEDACVTAHEIMHLIITKEKTVPNIYAHNRYPDMEICSKLTTLFQDPVIDSYLVMNYKFDLLTEYKKDLEWSMGQYETSHEEPKDMIGKLILALDLSCTSLRWDLYPDEKKSDWIAFKQHLGEWLPIVSSISDEIVSIINGAKTTDDLNSVFHEITKKYGLERILAIDPTQL